LRLLKLDDRIRAPEECGCGFRHDKTLEAVLIGSLEDALNHLRDFDLNPPYAVFSDDSTYRIAGGRVQRQLSASSIIVRSPTFQEAEARAREAAHARTFIAVGGGTVIDVAKYAAYLTGADFISIPTAPSHDGIISPITSLFTEGRRESILTRPPRVAIVDISIVSSAPEQLVASGYGDVLAKIVSLKDWQLGRDELNEPYCEDAENLILGALDLVADSLTSGEKSIEKLVEALIYCGASMMVVGSSRPASGSEHLISHYLDMHLGRRLRHGIQCAIGALAMAAYHESRNENWWRDERYRLRGLRRCVVEAGIPATLSDAGIPLEVMVEAVTDSWRIRPRRYTILHKLRPSRDEALEILEMAGLI